MEKEYYNLKELKAIYGISIRSWREWIKWGGLRAARMGKSYFVGKDDLLRFFKDKSIVRMK